ncbi:hypothetical protein LTS18_007665 [Coniosporium uncinatum]|uniref:Uncharacterized protein n=1 Tax=Coniosporium uncinatum TaxID=93489 RepID=A0ACC3DCP7_9PEZI|nr:hypothetical protein LTS18_007665 [Coniosporium uncinatum]
MAIEPPLRALHHSSPLLRHLLKVGTVKVAFCSQHGGCYTEDNIDRHLAEQHKIKRKRSTELITHLHAKGLTATHLRLVRDDWLLNDTPGPVAELSGSRLLGFEIGRNTVNQAQVRWHSDEEIIVYKDIQLTMDQLQELVAKELQAATDILELDFCFGMEGVPQYELSELVDNWDASSPGKSFLTDTRNGPYISDGQSWIFDQLRLHPELMKLLYKTDNSAART